METITHKPSPLAHLLPSDYHFVDKRVFLAACRAGQFLEAARVAAPRAPTGDPNIAGPDAPRGANRAFWYGTGLATVREVAASGRLCVSRLDLQGALALRANPRIDGLFVYVTAPGAADLEARQAARLKEAEATVARRVEWCRAQCARVAAAATAAAASAQQQQQPLPSGGGAPHRAASAHAAAAAAAAPPPLAFDHVVPNNGSGAADLDAAYLALKEAVSALSPVIRNRLRGLPAYVLDYSDLVAPDSVARPFLKPVVLSGPTTGERGALITRLVAEFPDVFGLPRAHTTYDAAEERRAHAAADGACWHCPAPPPLCWDLLRCVLLSCFHHQHTWPSYTPPKHLTGDELGLPDVLSADLPASVRHAAVASTISSSGDEGGDAAAAAAPAPVVLSRDEFDAWAAAGRFLEWHADPFKHALAAHRVGHTPEDVRAIVAAGRLPLLELESDGAEALKARVVDCLTIFLAPPSAAAFEARLRAWLTESTAELAARRAAAAAELEAARACGAFDAFVVNDADGGGYAELKATISRFRPDILPPAPARPPAAGAAGAAGEPGAGSARQRLAGAPPLVLCGATAAAREAVAARLLSRLPNVFALPPRVADRKPAMSAAAGAAAVPAPAPGVRPGSSAGTNAGRTRPGSSGVAGGSGSGGTTLVPAPEVLKPEAFAKLAATGQLALQWQDASGAQLGVTLEALRALSGAGKVAILEAASAEQAAAVQAACRGAALPPAPAAAAGAAMPANALAAVFAAHVCVAESAAAAAPEGLDKEAAAAGAAASVVEQAATERPPQHDGPFQAVVEAPIVDEAAAQLQAALARATPCVPVPMLPVVLVGPFGCGKRAALLKLTRELLPGLVATPPVMTTRPRADGEKDGEAWACDCAWDCSSPCLATLRAEPVLFLNLSSLQQTTTT